MIAGVADTHTAIWYITRNPSLSAVARQFIDDGAEDGHGIIVSPISLAEIVYLVGIGGIHASAYYGLRSALANPEYVIDEAPLNANIIEAMWRVARVEVPDMPDRIIAATAVYINVPVLSGDRRIKMSSVQTVW